MKLNLFFFLRSIILIARVQYCVWNLQMSCVIYESVEIYLGYFPRKGKLSELIKTNDVQICRANNFVINLEFNCEFKMSWKVSVGKTTDIYLSTCIFL